MAIIFTEGFDKYHVASDLLLGDWTTYDVLNGSGDEVEIVPGILDGTGKALRSGGGAAGYFEVTKVLDANYGTIIVGVRFKWTFFIIQNAWGIQFGDAGTAQVSIHIDGLGAIRVKRGSPISGTTLGTYTGGVFSGTVHYLEFKTTIDNAAGTGVVYLDGVQILNLSGVDTQASANAYINTMTLVHDGGVSEIRLDDMYLADTTGAAPNNDILGQPRIETVFPSSDVQVQFDMGTRHMGNLLFDPTEESASPGAQKIWLQKFTAPVSGNVSDISIYPAASSVTAKFKGVLYADNGSGTGPMGAALGSGSEVTGCTIAVETSLPFATTAAVVKDTSYWVGYMTDTSVLMYESDALDLAKSATITYPTIPATASTLSLASSITDLMVWANITTATSNYTEVNIDPQDIDDLPDFTQGSLAALNFRVGDESYIFSTTVGDTDLYGHGGLVTDPVTIFTVNVKALVKNEDAGARTIDLVMNSATTATTATGGTATGQSPPNSYLYMNSFFHTKAGATTVWTASELAVTYFGIAIAS